MPKKARDDELVMSLVETALAMPVEERDAYLQNRCAGDPELHQEVWNYVEWETRMKGFLLEPLYSVRAMEHRFEPGEILDQRFRIIREVAQGGMGIVYEAEDQKLERRVALKCAKAGFGKRLPPEVRHATEISHPNVCKTFEIHTASTRLGEIDFLTMEFLVGETLAERLARAALPEAEACTIARQLCAGLAEAHRNDVIHGDLKSNNVILTTAADGSIRAVITDFGLARGPETELRSPHTPVSGGTPDYMAPELWTGGKLSIASDIFALGVILHELAYGRRPRAAVEKEGKQPTAHLKWHIIIARCLDPDPSHRFRGVEEIGEALKPPRRSRWWLTAPAAAVLVILSTVVSYERASAPARTVRLAMLPMPPPDAALAIPATKLSSETEARLARLSGGKVARLSFIPLRQMRQQNAQTAEQAYSLSRATHVLQVALEKHDANVVVHGTLWDAQSAGKIKDWRFEYAQPELKYAPVALAGMVTSQLKLPPPAVASINTSAGQYYWGGLWYLRRNSTVDKGLSLLESAVAADPDSPRVWAALANAQQWKYFLTQQSAWLNRAEESVREASKRHPDFAELHRVVGLLKFREGSYELAALECQRAIELNPNEDEAYRVLGQTLEKNNRIEEALAAYRKAVEVNPAEYRNHQQLASFYYQRADYQEALRHLQAGAELQPGEPTTHYALGTDYLALGRLSEAERELRVAISLGETSSELHTLGIVLMDEGWYENAAECISRALTLGPETSLWRMNLGTVYRLMGRKPDSQKEYRRALVLAEQEMTRGPRDGKIRSYLAFLSARLGDPNRAESEIKQAQAMSPADDASVRFMTAATLEAMGRRDDAIKLLTSFSYSELGDVSRWPDMAGLSHDSRFLALLASKRPK